MKWNPEIKETEQCKVNGLPLPLWRKAAELTKNIKWNCKFRDGECIEGKCCASCARTSGNWDKHTGPVDNEQVGIMNMLYNASTGFLGPEGCLLPRRYRSPLCLAYSCGYDVTRESLAIISVITNDCNYPPMAEDIIKRVEEAHSKDQ